MKAELSETLSYLISGKVRNFYARIISALQHAVSSTIPYMAVSLKNRAYVMYHNPEWLEQAPFNEVLATVEHEAIHIIQGHIPRALELFSRITGEKDLQRAYRVMPIATDMACNSLLGKSNPWILRPENIKEWVVADQAPYNLPCHRSLEWYFNTMMLRDKASEESKKKQEKGIPDHGDGGEFHEHMKQMQQQMNQGNTPQGMKLIAHKSWEEMTKNLSPEEKQGLADEIKAKGKRVIEQAVEAHEKSHGSVPGELSEIIKKLLAPPTLPWTKILRDKVVNTKRWKWRRSVARPNRRKVGLAAEGIIDFAPFPGRSRDQSFTCAFCIDTSASMGEKDLIMALEELAGLQRADKDIEIHVLEADVNVEKEYLLTANKELQFDLCGRGGTDFNDALNRCKELKPDICFYYTDGYANKPLLTSRVHCPMVWLITPHGTTPDDDWGHVIRMVDKQL